MKYRYMYMLDLKYVMDEFKKLMKRNSGKFPNIKMTDYDGASTWHYKPLYKLSDNVFAYCFLNVMDVNTNDTTRVDVFIYYVYVNSDYDIYFPLTEISFVLGKLQTTSDSYASLKQGSINFSYIIFKIIKNKLLKIIPDADQIEEVGDFVRMEYAFPSPHPRDMEFEVIRIKIKKHKPNRNDLKHDNTIQSIINEPSITQQIDAINDIVLNCIDTEWFEKQVSLMNISGNISDNMYFSETPKK